MIEKIAHAFPAAWIASDICNAKLATSEIRSEMECLGISNWFSWARNDPKSMERSREGTELLFAQT